MFHQDIWYFEIEQTNFDLVTSHFRRGNKCVDFSDTDIFIVSCHLKWYTRNIQGF